MQRDYIIARISSLRMKTQHIVIASLAADGAMIESRDVPVQRRSAVLHVVLV